VLEGTVRPYPVLVIKYPGNKQNLVVKAEPAAGFKYVHEIFLDASHAD